MADTGINRRVVVTGMGAVTAIGHTVPDFWAGLRQGKCGVAPIERFFQNDPHFLLPSQIENFDLEIMIAAQIKGFDYKARLRNSKRDKLIMFADRYSLFAAAAADEAVKQSGLAMPFTNPYRAACIIGSAEGGVVNLEAAYRHIYELRQPSTHPLTLVRFIGSSAAAHVGIECGVKGPTFGACASCASGAQAIGMGRDYIRHGLVDVAIVGASDSPFTYGTMREWQATRLLSPQGIFPFARKSNGTVLAEGAGILVLEFMHHAKARGATILAELCGVGATSDCTDMINPDVVGASECMRLALEDAGSRPTTSTTSTPMAPASPRPIAPKAPRSSTRSASMRPRSRYRRPSPCMAIRWARAAASRPSPASRPCRTAGCRRHWGWTSALPNATSTTPPMSAVQNRSPTRCRTRSVSRA